MWYILLSLFFLLAPTLGTAYEEAPQRFQTQSVLVGVSVIYECPSGTVTQRLMDAGRTLRADSTVITMVQGQEFCPSTAHGAVYPHVAQFPIPGGTSVELGFGVTVGLHYRVEPQQ